MANILYLDHRLPYSPNKGDNVRSYHLLKHLARQHLVFLGTFVDDPDDEAHVATVRTLCADLHVRRLRPRLARAGSLNALLSGAPLTLRYYRSATMADLVKQTSRSTYIDAAVIFSSAMAQYVKDFRRLPTLIDFVDVNLAQYAPRHRWPLPWLYRPEGRLLLAYWRRVASRSVRSFFVTENEAALFCQRASECRGQVDAMGNGVDADYFSSDLSRPSPYKADELPVVFTRRHGLPAQRRCRCVVQTRGFTRCSEVLARRKLPHRRPQPDSSTAAGKRSGSVTGTVPDVRPYLQYAAVVVAPIRIARGIQNKILEAMSMAKPVIASVECAATVDAAKGTELLTAAKFLAYIAELARVLDAPAAATAIDRAARQRIVERYSWEAHLEAIDRYPTRTRTLPQ